MGMPRRLVATTPTRAAVGMCLGIACLSACGGTNADDAPVSAGNGLLRCENAGFYADYGTPAAHSGTKVTYGLVISVSASSKSHAYEPVRVGRATVQQIGGPFKKTVTLHRNRAAITIPRSVHRYTVKIHKGGRAATCSEERGIPRVTGTVHDRTSPAGTGQTPIFVDSGQ